EQVRIVERRAEGVRHAVAELAAFVDGARRLRGAMAAAPAREGEAPEELEQALFVLGLVREDLRIGPFEIGGREDAGRAVTGTREEDRVEIELLDQPIQMHPDEREAWARAPGAGE